MFRPKKEFFFNALIILAFINIFVMYYKAEIDLITTVIFTSIMFLGLYFRLLFEIYLIRKEL